MLKYTFSDLCISSKIEMSEKKKNITSNVRQTCKGMWTSQPKALCFSTIAM